MVSRRGLQESNDRSAVVMCRSNVDGDVVDTKGRKRVVADRSSRYGNRTMYRVANG